MLTLRVKRLDPAAQLPARAHPGDAAFDLTSIRWERIPAGGTTLIPTGLAIEVPTDHYGQLLTRSGMARDGFDVRAGVIDASYRGEVHVVLHNSGDAPATITVGMRVAQLVILPVPVVAVVVSDDLSPTVRGDAGFGSTGA